MSPMPQWMTDRERSSSGLRADDERLRLVAAEDEACLEFIYTRCRPFDVWLHSSSTHSQTALANTLYNRLHSNTCNSHTLPHTPTHALTPESHIPAISSNQRVLQPDSTSPPQTPNQQHPPSHSEMCIRVVERFAVCNCVYYVHGVDQCGAYGRRGHEIEDRNVPVGHTCPEHAAQGYQHGRMPVPSGDRHMGVLPDTFGSSGSSYSYGGYHSSGSHR